VRPRALITLIAALLAVCGSALAQASPPDLAREFRRPPDSARPWVYWFWLNGNITREGITADLEAMARVGVGGVLIMEVDQGAPVGPVGFAGTEWRELFKHVVSEAHRLGLEVNMNNDAGWCGSGGPWVTPDLAMQRLVWTETGVRGPGAVSVQLPQPPAVAGYYRDVAVLAYPTPADKGTIAGIAGKSVAQPLAGSLPAPTDWPSAPAERIVPPESVLDLTPEFTAEGTLSWDAPAGEWTVVRIGHTPTGAVNGPSPASGQGLECDKMSRQAATAMFDGLMGKVADDVGPLAGETLVSTHIDSWEVGVQNWTPRFREDFRERRGYDPLPYLPIITGRVVGDRETSERFLWDWRQTISELVLDNYAGAFRDLANERGMRLSIEAYTTCPTDEMAYAGRADEPMGEFWAWGRYGAAFSVREMASAGHVYGKPVIGAEAFTSSDGEAWLGHPGNIRELGDWAFCEGINRFVFHRYALQPWPDIRPGMSMGPWGLHYERTETWWEQSGAWHRYLARCQHLLRQGVFVADTCLLGPEGSPQSLSGQTALASLERPPFNFDTCPPDALMSRMTVRNGRLVLPDGMSYRMLALPHVRTMTPGLLRKVRDLVWAGATVVGPRPVKSPGLSGYPGCDEEVRRIAAELWGTGEPPAKVTERRVGKGRIVWGGAFEPAVRLEAEEELGIASARWIWTPEGNPAASAPPGPRYFRCRFTLPSERRVESARLVLTADNTFQCWVNGRLAGSGDTFTRLYTLDVTSLLRPGGNLLTVTAVNTTSNPSPAGLIGSLSVRYADGTKQAVATDLRWEAAATVPAEWQSDASAGDAWSPAMELGPMGIPPWGDVETVPSASDLYPSLDLITGLYEKWGVPPDFDFQAASGARSLRYTHRRVGDTDLYFVSNKEATPQDALCSFRPTCKRPELWWPDTGDVERAAVYDVSADGLVRLPLRLGPYGSVFVVFPAGGRPEPDRVTTVERDGLLVASTEWQPRGPSAVDNNAGATGSFTFAVWARPDVDTPLPPESNSGATGMGVARNDALYPPPGHEVYADPRHAGCGVAIGRNGVCVFEHSADYFAPVLVWPAPLTGWTHVAVVYRDGRPTLYLDGKPVHRGLRSWFAVHSGVGVTHTRDVRAFLGDLGPFAQVPRPLSDAEVARLARSMPRPRERARGGHLDLSRNAAGGVLAIASEPGAYTLRSADGRARELVVSALLEPLPVAGPWEVRFAPGWGAPERIVIDHLSSWHESSDLGIRYYSGVATYTTTFHVPASMLGEGRRLTLDLGAVAVVADVTLNGHALGTLWNSPFEVDATETLRPGANTLEVRVANLWVNRQIGDEQLPEDSARNPNGTLRAWPQWLLNGELSPTGRRTFTSWRLWAKDSPLQESGLLGPVELRSRAAVSIG